MELDEFTERMFSIERRLGLFADRLDGLPWWDAVRYDVYTSLYREMSALPGAKPDARSLLSRLGGRVMRGWLSFLLQLRVRFGRYDVLVLRAARQLRDGKLSDPAIDDFISLCPGRLLTINTSPHYHHILRASSVSAQAIRVPALIQELIEALHSELGSSWDEDRLRALIVAGIAQFENATIAYRKLFARVRPRLVIMTQNGMEKALFFAANEAGIRVIEGQHGLIGATHPAYAYPRDVDYQHSPTFPAVFLEFSSHWARSCFYPAGRCLPIGNDHFVPGVSPPSKPLSAIMFVASAPYHVAMLPWVTGLAAALPHRELIYKLHPGQRFASEAIRRELSPWQNIRVVDASLPARALLAEVSHVVVIQSTVALEALQSGRRVCILPLFEYRTHTDLFDLREVAVTGDIEQLIAAVNVAAAGGDPPTFFDPFDAQAAMRLLSDLLPSARRFGGPDQAN